MPTYEYECDSCGHRFEQFQTITARPIRKCPRCAKSKARRLISAGAGVIFKGSGFYQTDYRSESYKQAAQKDKSPTAASSAESKPSATSKSEASSPSTASPAKSESKATSPAEK